MNIKFHGDAITTNGNYPKKGDKLPEMKLVKSDLSEINTNDLKGKKIVFNTIPSVDTGVCAMHLTKFAEKLKGRDDVMLVFTSMDLPFAQSRFCSTKGIDNAITTSDFRYHDAEKLGSIMESGPLKGLHARGVIITDEDLNVIYSEMVDEVTNEPNYEEALKFI
ncbi:MAG: thiol peroxidase [Brumimicrobium sp.]|nr:thiol peroxidase [Brumimicrobium sp.]